MEHDESQAVSKGSCEKCGSSDANTLYDDGHSFCYGCRAYTHGDSMNSEVKLVPRGTAREHATTLDECQSCVYPRTRSQEFDNRSLWGDGTRGQALLPLF